MRRLRICGVAVLAALALTGCFGWMRPKAAALPPAPALEARPVPVETKPPADQAQLREQLARVAAELSDLQNAVARVTATSQRHDGELQAIERRLGELSARARDGVAPAPPGFAPAAPIPAPPPASSPAITTPEDLFGTGLAKYRAGELDAALLVLYELIANYPSHPLRATAQIHVADIYYAQKNFRGALSELESLLDTMPAGAKTPDVLVKAGLCQRKLGDVAKARAAWTRVVKEYPGSAAARQAQTLLRDSRGG